MRRVLGLSLGSAMVMALFPGAALAQTDSPDAISTDNICDESEFADNDFDDIEGSAHEDNIRCMADYGLTEGLRGGDDYGPRLDVTRGQMASFIARFIETYEQAELDEGTPVRFTDVPPGYVHAENINKLANIGVVQGTNASNGTAYAPNADVTRAQMGSFIRRALSYVDNGEVDDLSAPPSSTDDFFPDDAGSVHEDNIDAIAGVGIVQGFTDGTYRPGDAVKRDQMASFVMRAFSYAVSENLGAGDPDPEDGPTIATSTLDTDVTDVDGDTGTASTGDSWTLVFDADVDVDGIDTGATFELTDGTTDYTVQCVDDTLPIADTEVTAATCTADGDTVTITLLEDTVDTDGNQAMYPVDVTGTSLTSGGEAIDFDADGDFEIDVDADTDSVALPLP